MKITSVKLISPIVIIFLLLQTSCTTNSSMDNTSNNLADGTVDNAMHSKENSKPSVPKKYYKNIQASFASPSGFQEVENAYSYSFVGPNEESVYIASLYQNQSSDQVKQILESSLNQNGYKISLLSDYEMNAGGMSSADAKMEFDGVVYPGYIIVREMPNNNTYVFFGCVDQERNKEQMKGVLNDMAISLEIETSGAMENNNRTTTNVTAPVNESVQGYQNFLMDKVLVNSKQSRDIISGDDSRASHGKWILSEDVSKTRRFLLCAGGFSYFRFVSTGHQITGDYGTVELDKWSGFWKVISEAGKFYIYMEDERNGRYRTWEINGIENNLIFIDNRPYVVYTQQEGGNECGKGAVVVPQ